MAVEHAYRLRSGKGSHRGMSLRRAAATLFAVFCLVAIAALPAAAHAQLEETSPVDGETVPTSPGSVAVTFNERVTAPAGAIRVFDTAGTRVDSGSVESTEGGARLVGALDEGLRNGTYIATWRAVSADGHPISGAFVFHVGEPGASVDESLIASLVGDAQGRTAAVAAGVARWASYLASLVVIGAFVFAAKLEPKARPETTRVIQTVGWVGIGFSLLQIPLFAMSSTGLGVPALGSGTIWGDALGSSVGVAALIRTAGLGLMLAATRSWAIWMGWLSVTILVGAELITGHTRTTEPVWLVLPADAVHVLAAGIWLGGLVALAVVHRGRRAANDPAGAANALGRFSRLAAWTVLALTVAGGALAWSQVRAPRALTSTVYGWMLIAKVGLVVAVLGVAAYNNRVLVPRLSGGSTEASAWQRLRRTVGVEMLGLILAVGLTAFLVDLQPAAEAAGVSGPLSVYVEFGERQLNLVVDPNRAGLNSVHATVFSAGGLPARLEGPVTFEFSLPDEEIGPILREPQVAGPNHVIFTGTDLAIPGDWEITVRERVSEFEEEVAVVQVEVNR